jgi:predicted O-methyltransferase YrrM
VKLVPERELALAYRRALDLLCINPDATAYVEFGVFNGTSLACMSAAAAASGRSSLRLIGIDSFKGLPATVAGEDLGVWTPGQFACSQEDAIRCLTAKGVFPPAYALIDGWYSELQNARIAASLGERSVSVIMIDCDAYSSAKSALDLITPFMAQRAVIFFDDWRLNDLDVFDGGEYRAFNEWRDAHPEVKVEAAPRYNRKSEAFVLTFPIRKLA